MWAVAVAPVVAYHANPAVVPGGYVGVDVSYVLSGFFITGLFVREYATKGRISFLDFYARRIRSLFPAAALVILWQLNFIRIRPGGAYLHEDRALPLSRGHKPSAQRVVLGR